MKLEELKPFWEKDIKVLLVNGKTINGFFCSFERTEDEPSGRACITVETEVNGLIDIYLDEIKEITISMKTVEQLLTNLEKIKSCLDIRSFCFEIKSIIEKKLSNIGKEDYTIEEYIKNIFLPFCKTIKKNTDDLEIIKQISEFT